MNETDSPAQSLVGIEADQLAQLVARASDEELAAGMVDEESRKATLDEIFRRMTEHVKPERARGNNAVVHFRITERPGGGEDVYEVVLEDGACAVSREPRQEPRVAFTVGPVDFLRLVSGNVAGPMLFMAGKLKIQGDLMFAATMTSLFRIPSAVPASPAASSDGSAA